MGEPRPRRILVGNLHDTQPVPVAASPQDATGNQTETDAARDQCKLHIVAVSFDSDTK